MSENKFTPILPFQDTMNDNFIIYDNVVYYRNKDLATDADVKIHNPNMIKYYTTAVIEPVKIGGD